MRTEKKLLISIVNLCLAATLFAAPNKCGVDYATDTTSSPPSICKMTMFDQWTLEGKSVEITGNTNDFKDIDFDNAMASVRVEGKCIEGICCCCWSVFTDSDYKGEIRTLTPGTYQLWELKEVFKEASSARNAVSTPSGGTIPLVCYG